MSHIQRYFAWMVAYLVAVTCLFIFADLRMNWWQTGLFISAVICWGESQQSYVRHDLRRQP